LAILRSNLRRIAAIVANKKGVRKSGSVRTHSGLEITVALSQNAQPMQTRLLRLLTFLVVAAALAFPFFLALEKIHEPDFFWHLATGEWILAHGQVPHADVFSSTMTGRPWIDWEWLFQVAIRVVYAQGGFAALVVAKAAVVLLAALVLFDTSRRNGAQPLLAALGVLAAFVAARDRLEVQPDVLMFLFAATTLAMLEAARLGAKDLRRSHHWWLLGLPVVEVIWVNVHASFPLGLCLAGAYLIGELVGVICTRDRLSQNTPESRMKFAPAVYLGVCLLICAAACLLNPYGWRLIGHVVEQSRSTGPAGMISEWFPTRSLLIEQPNWALWTFWVLFWLTPSALTARLLVGWRKFPWAHALVVAGMSALALKANRFTGLYAVVTIPILAGAVAVVWQKIVGCERPKGLPPSPRPRPAGNLAAKRALQFAAILLIGALAVFLNWAVISNRWAVHENRAVRFGVGVDEQLVPLRALDVMKKLPSGLGLFNTVVSGGALIWELYPDWRVFADGRANLYGRAFVDQYRAALVNPLEWEKWMRARGVGIAYIQYGPEDDAVLVHYLAKNPAWQLFYFDHAACIFLNRSALEKLSPQVKALGTVPEQSSQAAAAQSYAHRLADELAGQSPYDRARMLTTIGNFLMTIEERASARRLFDEAVALWPGISVAWMRLAELALLENKLDDALAFTTQLLARNPRFYQARLMQAQIRAVQGDLVSAVALAEQVLRQQPHSAKTWVVRAQLCVRQRNRPEAIRALRRAVAEGSEDSGIYIFLARLLEAEGRNEEAIQAYESCLRIWPGTPEQQEPFRRQIDVLRRVGRNKKSTPP
jgi:tetratricopeptide (TPR) repeat protein